MDSVKRFTAQHIEFEAEWETAFNIQLKMHDCISLMISWCQTDTQVLKAAYSATLRRLANASDNTTIPTTNVIGKRYYYYIYHSYHLLCHIKCECTLSYLPLHVSV